MKCPYCKADIEDNARFCFYCMTSLAEKETVATPVLKKKYWAVVIAALFVVALITGGVLWLMSRNPEEPSVSPEIGEIGEILVQGTDGESTPQPNQNTAVETPTAPGVADPNQSVSSPVQGGADQSVSSPSLGNPDQPTSSPSENVGGESSPGYVGSGVTSSGSTPQSGQTTPSAPATQPEQTVPSTPATQPEQTVPSAPATQPEEIAPSVPSTQPETTPPDTSEPSAPDASEPEKEEEGSTVSPPASSAVYTYRAAKYAVDDYLVTANVEDCVVITGVETPSADGIYQIPSTLDGKKVIAIVSHAFSSETVKEVHLPASVRTVHDYAFTACRNLTDIYFEGKSIYVSSLAFAPKEKRTGTLTIHCSYDCNNRDFRYYRNIAESYYDAEWSEA